MPIPTPKEDEEKKDFISRCMANKIMNSDYPENEQRAAVCHSQWKKSKKKKIKKIILNTVFSFRLTDSSEEEQDE